MSILAKPILSHEHDSLGNHLHIHITYSRTHLLQRQFNISGHHLKNGDFNSLPAFQIQFHVTIGHTALSLYVNCDFPHWMHYSLICYAITFIVLFGNFYYQTYRRQQPRRDASSSSKAGKAISNGTFNGLSKAANGAAPMGGKEEKPQESSSRRKRKGRAKRD